MPALATLDLFDRREPGEAPRAHAMTPPPGRFRLVVVIPGKPVPKGRPRAFKLGEHIRMHTPVVTLDYENRVRFAAKSVMGLRRPIDREVALAAHLRVFLAAPASWSKRKTADALSGRIVPVSRPDCDNYLKAVGDACNGIIWADDCQLADARCTKHYAAEPRAVLEVWAL